MESINNLEPFKTTLNKSHRTRLVWDYMGQGALSGINLHGDRLACDYLRPL